MYKFAIETNSKLEKRFRYSLGQNMETNILELLDKQIKAKNAPKALKSAFLLEASSLVEIIILKFRLLLELKLANETKIFQAQADLAEIGRMLGGWRKSLQQ